MLKNNETIVKKNNVSSEDLFQTEEELESRIIPTFSMPDEFSSYYESPKPTNVSNANSPQYFGNVPLFQSSSSSKKK